MKYNTKRINILIIDLKHQYYTDYTHADPVLLAFNVVC